MFVFVSLCCEGLGLWFAACGAGGLDLPRWRPPRRGGARRLRRFPPRRARRGPGTNQGKPGGWDGGETTKRFKSNSKWNSFSPLFANLSTMFMLIMLSEWHDMLVAKLEAVHVHVRWASKLRLLQCMNVFLSPSNRCSLHQFYGCAQSQAQTNASSLSSLGFSQMELHKWFEDDDRCHFIIWRYVSSIIGIGQLWVGVRISVMIM